MPYELRALKAMSISQSLEIAPKTSLDSPLTGQKKCFGFIATPAHHQYDVTAGEYRRESALSQNLTHPKWDMLTVSQAEESFVGDRFAVFRHWSDKVQVRRPVNESNLSST